MGRCASPGVRLRKLPVHRVGDLMAASGIVKKLIRRPYTVAEMFLPDPIELINRWRGVPYFVGNARDYRRRNRHASFRLQGRELWFRSYDRFAAAGSLAFHYFHQDLWA